MNRLCTIARERWDAISNKTALTFDEVERARGDAGQLLILSGARETTASQAKDDLHRALTLLVRGYEEARDAIAYLRRNEGDIASIAPSLFANRAKRGKSDGSAAGATPTPPIVAPVTPAPPAAAPVAPAPVIATPAPAPVVAGGETPASPAVVPTAVSSDVQLTESARKSA